MMKTFKIPAYSTVQALQNVFKHRDRAQPRASPGYTDETPIWYLPPGGSHGRKQMHKQLSEK